MYRVSRTIRRDSEEPGPPQGFLRAHAGAKAGAAIGHDDRRSEARYACDCPARIASSDRVISTAGRIVNISAKGAKVEVMFPRGGPSTIFLVDSVSTEIYECEVRWRTGFYIGVRFLDVLGPGRRRMFNAGEVVPIKYSAHTIVELDEPPKEHIRPGPPPSRLFVRPAPKKNSAPSSASLKPNA
jgi:hypothetical protein